MILPTGPVWSFVQPHEPASRPVPRFIAQGQRNENQAVSRLRSTKSRREVPKRAQWTSCCPMTSGTSCGRKKGCRRRILNEWCAPHSFRARSNGSHHSTNLGAANELTADYRSTPAARRYCGGEGHTAPGIGRGRGHRSRCSKRGHFLATPMSARNAPSATPGDRARARRARVDFCVRDDPAEIAGCQLRRFV